VCFAHGTVGRFLVHTWVNAEPVPRFYPNVVTLTTGDADIAEQRQAVRILQKSHLPGRWAVKDSFRTLDIARLGFEVLLEAKWIRKAVPKAATMVSGLAWERVTAGSGDFPAALFSDDNFAMFSAKRDGTVVAGGTLYRSDGVVGLSNVVAEADDEPADGRDQHEQRAQRHALGEKAPRPSDDAPVEIAHGEAFRSAAPPTLPSIRRISPVTQSPMTR